MKEESPTREPPPMTEDAKYGRETMNKVLGWGTIVYFLVLGFSGNQHALFELYPLDEQAKLAAAKRQHASELDFGSTASKAEAAQARLDARLIEEEMSDARRRAKSLILGAGAFCLLYPFAIWVFYRKNITRYATKYFIPCWLAVLYGFVMSAVTFSVALLTAIY